jgi:hypothetical protein
MSRRSCIPICITLATFLTACASPTALPTLVPTLAPLPALTPTPIPTPTATPIPPLVLTIYWPAQVSALQPVPIEVELLPPPGIAVTATVHAVVRVPGGGRYRSFDLQPSEGNRYVSTEPLQLPLQAREGDWRLDVIVQSALEVAGERRLLFQPSPIHCRDLAGTLPSAVDVCVPRDFVEFAAQGDQVAGERVWRYGSGEVGLWWAPGPVEPFLLNTALVMLETTYGVDAPAMQGFEETAWQGQAAFLFREDWPGAEGGPGEALVIQGPDRWLYVLRVRALGSGTIPPFLWQIRDTLTWVGE